VRAALVVVVLWPAFVFGVAHLINTMFDAWGQR